MMAIKAMAILCGALAALYALHRLCDWAESRGWIHYRKTRASGNALGASALQLQDLFESGKASHVLEAQELKAPRNHDAGPEPPARPRP
jgi:hypothetical protein